MKSAYTIPLEHTLAIVDLSDIEQLWPELAGQYIHRINVPQQFRGQGLGTQLLTEVCLAADAENTCLWLDINPYGQLSFEQLEEWYRRYGFELTQHGVDRPYMMRLPKRIP